MDPLGGVQVRQAVTLRLSREGLGHTIAQHGDERSQVLIVVDEYLDALVRDVDEVLLLLVGV